MEHTVRAGRQEADIILKFLRRMQVYLQIERVKECERQELEVLSNKIQQLVHVLTHAVLCHTLL